LLVIAVCDKTQPVGHVQHDPSGAPVVNKTRFPNLSGLVSDGHAKQLNMGW